MKKYNFLFKPLFFIFSLIFATFLVLYIERISPSDFGRYESLFKDEPSASPSIEKRKDDLKKLFYDYANGKIDSLKFDGKLEKILKGHE